MTSPSTAEPGTFLRLLQKVVAVQPEELPAVGWCWVYAFALLAAGQGVFLRQGPGEATGKGAPACAVERHEHT